MKAGDFFGEIGILNLDGLNKRTADVRSVGYSELFSLSREDVLAAMKDYPEAQEILQNLGRKRLMEAQRVARAARRPTSPGHDSSDNSTGKRIVDKLKSDVKGLKNVLRKSRRNTRPEESLELQPLAPKFPTLKRQQKIDESQDLCLPNSQEPPVSPLGAGLPLLSRLRLLKEKEEREERRNLMDMSSHAAEPQPPPPESLNPTNPNLPFLQRILLLKAKNEQEAQAEKETLTKEPLLPKNTIPEETSQIEEEQSSSGSQAVATITSETETRAPLMHAKKPWAMLKNSLIKNNSPQKSPPTRKLQQTKMYASVDDLSPEYCGLPFVKKLKILNERQKLAELEKAVRSSSLDCGENAEPEFDGNLTRSHSEACAIEYARKLAKFNQDRQASARISSVEQLSPENETLERRNLKSILKKLSASSRTGSSETSATSTPDREAATAELKRLMRAPTIEGYAARHSKLSKSVTFNKYTLQSPPSEQATPQPNYPLSEPQDQPPLPPPNKLSFRPVGNVGVLQMVPRPREEECLGELLSGISEVIKAGLENMQIKFEQQFTSLELEVRKRDEIISQLQTRIQELERRESHDGDDFGGDSTEHDASLEEDLDDDREDHPFMRDSSVDTVLTTRSHDRRSSSSLGSSSRSRRSWEEHSERETLELQELPNSIVPQRLLSSREDVAIDLESNSDSRSDEEFDVRQCRKGDSDEGDEEDDEAAEEEDDEDEDEDDDDGDDDDDDDDDKIVRQDGYNNWEVALLAKQLEARRKSGDNAGSPGS
ncbi:Cyclic nucleotide-gated cation channel alpha-3 [Harpegnathos saltator]|uniref:Cyclic nucleotide-gated cation channel alpha-3 n=1 Tax=Harpegnathos saltator TaxID=610380 RepID=E2BQN5_HARSA|nr:Cyclic nucleotide-gated cation channel alpha-3 [Harpegnathos saltator]